MNHCNCKCHKLEQHIDPIIGKMVFCDCMLPHGNAIECGYDGNEPIKVDDLK